MTSLPKAIQQQVEAADQMMERFGKGEPAQQSETPQNDPNQAAEVVEGQDPQTQDPQPQPPVVPQEEPWQHRYLSLKGKYDAEVPMLAGQVRELKAQMHAIQQHQLQAPKPQEQPKSDKPAITDRDREVFGADLLELIERVSDQKVSKLSEREAHYQREIAELKGQLGNMANRQVVSDKDRFELAMTQLCEGWQTQNNDQRFIDWLNQVDPVYGLPRMAALHTAVQRFDAQRAAAIFLEHRKTLAPPPGQNLKQQAQQELQRQVAPTRSRSTAAPTDAQQNKRIFTQAEIQQFYRDATRGTYNEKDAARMEQEIFAAAAEGRVAF